MKRSIGLILAPLAAVLLVGTIAAATPGLRSTDSQKATPSMVPPSPNVEAPGRDTPAAMAVQSDPSGGAPDFSACSGLTGLENAICRHEALPARASSNAGVSNALAHLQENLAKQHGRSTSKGADRAHGPASDDHSEAQS